MGTCCQRFADPSIGDQYKGLTRHEKELVKRNEWRKSSSHDVQVVNKLDLIASGNKNAIEASGMKVMGTIEIGKYSKERYHQRVLETKRKQRVLRKNKSVVYRVGGANPSCFRSYEFRWPE